MKKRLFLAIPLIKTYLAVLDKYEKQSSFPYFQFVPLQNLHLTVYFLGDVDVQRIPSLIQRLKDSLSSTNAFALEFEEIIFAPPKKPFMLWMTFEKSKRFFNLVDAVAKIAEEYVSLKTIYSIIPHVTLARFKVAPNIKLKQPKIKDNLKVQSCELVESKPVSKEPTYSVIELFKLAS